MTADDAFVTHAEPVWRDRANFIINAELPESDLPKRYEQLWARQLSDDTFALCCIPFFLYDVALGDVVTTAARGDRRYVLDRVVEPSGRYAFRVWFGGTPSPPDAVVDRLTELGALLEWSSRNLLAVDAENEELAQRVADLLADEERSGRLTYETGRSA